MKIIKYQKYYENKYIFIKLNNSIVKQLENKMSKIKGVILMFFYKQYYEFTQYQYIQI